MGMRSGADGGKSAGMAHTGGRRRRARRRGARGTVGTTGIRLGALVEGNSHLTNNDA